MEQKQASHIVRTKTFIVVWVALIFLTALNIEVAELQLGKLSMIANLLIASVMASLVIWFFMHLKYERPLFKYLLLIPVITITVMIGLTFFDIWYR